MGPALRNESKRGVAASSTLAMLVALTVGCETRDIPTTTALLEHGKVITGSTTIVVESGKMTTDVALPTNPLGLVAIYLAFAVFIVAIARVKLGLKSWAATVSVGAVAFLLVGVGQVAIKGIPRTLHTTIDAPSKTIRVDRAELFGLDRRRPVEIRFDEVSDILVRKQLHAGTRTRFAKVWYVFVTTRGDEVRFLEYTVPYDEGAQAIEQAGGIRRFILEGLRNGEFRGHSRSE